MAATGTPRLSTYSTPATPANRSLSVAPAGPNGGNSNANAAAAAPPLPPPATFDLLPHLHTLLNRLLIQKPTDASNAQAGGEGAPQSGGGAPSGEDAKAGTGGAGGSGQSQTDPDAAPLEIHQLAAASSALKVRLQKARQACTRLGDMDRTTEEQEEEIQELEERVRKLKSVLEGLGVGTGSAGGDGQ